MERIPRNTKCILKCIENPDVGKRALFVKDIEVITDNSDLCDVIFVFGDFNLPLNVTTDLAGK
jgi:hypothetical protein